MATDFIDWICNLSADDNPLGDFIRDTRAFKARGGQDDQLEATVFAGVPKAGEIYHMFRDQFRGENPEATA